MNFPQTRVALVRKRPGELELGLRIGEESFGRAAQGFVPPLAVEEGAFELGVGVAEAAESLDFAAE